MERGSRRPCRDADVVRPHRSGDVASSRSAGLALLAFPTLAFPHARPELVGLGVAIAGIVFGTWLWLRRVRAEIRAAEGLPFLVPRSHSSGIVGAEPDAPVRGGAPAGPAGRGRSAPANLRLAGGGPLPAPPPLSIARATAAWPASPRHAPGPAPTPETPAIPLAGGVHALLVSAVAGPRPAARAPAPAPAVRAKSSPPAEEPVDATLQLLPGRFEVAGAPRSQDLRFVRQPGPVTEVVLGRGADRGDGQVLRLDAPTVSRRHARLRFEDGRWTITNLSRINPVRLNGRVLAESAGPQRLGEGDRVEVGEVLLLFRER